MESAKKLHGGLLLTDDKNLLVRLRDIKGHMTNSLFRFKQKSAQRHMKR